MMQRRSHVKPPNSGETRLDGLQRHAFDYFLNETNLANGLVADKSQPGAPASIAAVGFALAAYPVGVERAWISRISAIDRTLAALRFFSNAPQGTDPDTVIPPFLTGLCSRIHAAIFSFCAGVMPPMPILGLSLL